MKNRIIFFSGGRNSFSTADYVKTRYPQDNILLYFTDTLWENDDLYRFIDEASDKLQLPMLTHSLGINPIQLMFEQRVIFNNRICNCSRTLKIEVASNFLRKGIIPKIVKWRNKKYLKSDNISENAILYFGIGFDEMHRENAIIENWKPFRVRMPLIEHTINNEKVLKKYNIRQPILYDYGFAHNNCNARCVRAGQGHYRNLKWKMPDVFKNYMEQEHYLKLFVSEYHYIKQLQIDGLTDDVKELWLDKLDKAYRDYFYDRKEKPDVVIPTNLHIDQYSIMKKTKNKITYPYPLRDFHYDTEKEGYQTDIFDLGGCGCFTDYSDALQPYQIQKSTCS